MTVRKPHFLLYCDATMSAARTASEATATRCKWRCVVDGLNDQTRMEIADSESDSTTERGALVAVIRGLEALEQPSQVTLITSSPYVNKGMRYGLKEWRENDYRWEHFGTEKPIRNADLWKRVDQAMQFHAVECRLIESSNPMFRPESNAAESEDKILRIDGSHLEPNPQVIVQVASIALQSKWMSILSSGMVCVSSVVGGFFRIPEQTVYAIESIFDRMIALLHQNFAVRNSFQRGISRG